RMPQEAIDPGGVRVRGADAAQVALDAGPIAARYALGQLDAQHRRPCADVADTDQRGPAHLRVGVEDRLDLLGKQRAGRGRDPVRLAAAEPQPALGVEVAHVAHAMYDAITARRVLADLRQPRLRVAVEVGVGRGRPGDGDLADVARR